MLKKAFLSAITILSFSALYSQQAQVESFLPTISPASPDVNSFNKFGNFQVNMFTGLPDITIPLYEIKVGELDVPVSISYHASGIKVNDWGSWVGIGWGLNAGGNISRQVMGLPDEKSENYYGGGTVQLAQNVNTATTAGLYYLQQVYWNTIDAEPDIFSYSYPGKSGKFAFNAQNSMQPIIMPYAPITINPGLNGQNFSFDITDERGVNAQFHTPELTQSSHGGTSSQEVTSWMLTKLMSANKQDSITFAYTERDGVTSQDYSDFVILNDEVLNLIGSPYSADEGLGYTDMDQEYVSEQKINEIDFRGGKVVFDPSVADRQDGFTGQKSLSDIKVYNYDPQAKTYSLIKTIYFYQSYFTNGSDQTAMRLRLDSLGIADNAGNVVEKYKFTYNTSIAMPSKVNSRARDFWGYYNGKANNTLVPQTVVTDYASNQGNAMSSITIGSTVPNSRAADPNYMQGGILQSIYFPTGGYTTFTFETNKCVEPITGNWISAGGLRVASIQTYDGINPTPMVKTYKYGGNEWGYGRSNYLLASHFNVMTQTFNYWSPQTDGNGDVIGGACELLGATKRVRTYYCTPDIAQVPYDEAPVVYDTVTEYVGSSTANTGRTIYVFTDNPDGLGTSMAFNKPIVTSYFENRGQLADKSVYRVNTDGTYAKIQETVNTYQAFAPQIYQNVGMVVFKHTISQDPNNGDMPLPPYSSSQCNYDTYNFNFQNYSIRSADNRLTATTEYMYDQSDPSNAYTATTLYYYDNFTHQQVTRVNTTNSKGDSLKTVKQYPADQGAVAPYNTMASLNIQDKVVQEQHYKNATQLTKLNTNYASEGSGNYLPANIALQVTTNPAETRASFNKYDFRGNILEMQKTADEKISAIWDYQSVYPAAQVTNAAYADIAYTSFEADSMGNWAYSGAISTSAAAMTGRRYYNLTTANTIVKNGLTSGTTYTVSYWSTSGSYSVTGSTGYITGKTVKRGTTNWTYYEHTVTGATSVTVSGTGNIDELRLYPSTAQMTTYTYTPLVGMTTQCDVNNRATYYEYDSFNRLKDIKDQDGNILKTYDYHYTNTSSPQ